MTASARQPARCYRKFRAIDAESRDQAKHLRQGQVEVQREISNQLFVRQGPHGVKPRLISSLHGVASVKYATNQHRVFKAVPRPLCGSTGPLRLLPSKRRGSSVELQPISTALQQQRPHLR
jgi:hypothetical protein